MSDYAALSDRELDALVAERVMGWTEVDAFNAPPHTKAVGYPPGWVRKDDGIRLDVPHLSTTGDGALAVIEAMLGHGWKLSGAYRANSKIMEEDKDDWLYRVTFNRIDEYERGIASAQVQLLPRAVSLAALAALDAEAV